MIVTTKATHLDKDIIQLIGRETFFETFAKHNSEADMKKYLEDSFNDEKVLQELNNPESFFFIAWEDRLPIGYMKLNIGNAQTEVKENSAIEIERIYVKTAYHGKKVGQTLYNKSLEFAKEKQKSYIWLGVWEENPRAINFYKKNGFVEFDKHIFKLGNDEQTDIMMKKFIE